MKSEMKKPKLPNKIIILSIPYKILYTDDLIKANLDLDGEKERVFGSVDLIKKEIAIFNQRPLESIFNTLLHEIIHAIIFELGIAFPLLTDESKDERLVKPLATALSSVLIENKFLRLF